MFCTGYLVGDVQAPRLRHDSLDLDMTPWRVCRDPDAKIYSLQLPFKPKAQPPKEAGPPGPMGGIPMAPAAAPPSQSGGPPPAPEAPAAPPGQGMPGGPIPRPFAGPPYGGAPPPRPVAPPQGFPPQPGFPPPVRPLLLPCSYLCLQAPSCYMRLLRKASRVPPPERRCIRGRLRIMHVCARPLFKAGVLQEAYINVCVCVCVRAHL